MKAMVLAAGLGTRLKPWTLEHPKALVPVQGVPMLERVLRRLENEGFTEVVINVHHFASQIIDFLKLYKSGLNIMVSDESEMLLDTGGGIAHAAPLLVKNSETVLIHNVDILSDAPLNELMRQHLGAGNDVTLLVNNRASTRRLFFDNEGRLCGWKDMSKGIVKPDGFQSVESGMAFSGIYVLSPKAILLLQEKAAGKPLPIMKFFLEEMNSMKIKAFEVEHLRLIDIGKPETLKQADEGLL